MHIAVPSEAEQEKVVEKIEILENIINKEKQQLENIEKLKKFRFIEMFGDSIRNEKSWEVQLLGNVSDVRDGTHNSPKYVEKGYPLITSKNLKSGYVDLKSNINYINKYDYEDINKRSKVDIGDILMPMIGTIGNPVIVDIVPEFAIKNVCLIKFKDNKKINNIFLKNLLSNSTFLQAKTNTRGGTQKFISLTDIRNIKIILPPLSLQQKFADFVEETDKLKVAIEKSLEETEQLYNALMQKYFG